MANEKRLIDAKELMENGWHLVKTGESNVFLASMSLADVPAVDAVEVVHGWWIHPKGYVVSNGFLCSECAYGTTSYRPIRPCGNGGCLADEQGNFYYPPEYKYCPNCGAKMDKNENP